MKNHLPAIHIGHLKIIDHLLLGAAAASFEASVSNFWKLVPVSMNSWDCICDGLEHETIHGAFITTPLALELYSSGMDIRFLMFVHRSGSLIITNRKAGIHSLSDFSGKSVLIPGQFSTQAILFHKLLATAKLVLGPHDQPGTHVAREIIPPHLMPDMLRADADMDIAGCMVPEPFGSLAINQRLADQFCTSHSLWKDHPCCGFVITRKFMNTHPRILGELMTLFFTTAKTLADTNFLELVPCFADFLKQDPVFVQSVLSGSNVNFTPRKLVPDLDTIDMMQRYMMEAMGIIPHKIDLENFVDKTWALEALSDTSIEN